MHALINFWSHALAAGCFAALMIWRLGEAARQPSQRLLAAAFAMTACWAWLAAVAPDATLLGFAVIWTYDLNLYTSLYLGSGGAKGLIEWRGLAVACAAPLFALATRREAAWRMRLSRAATFQSLSLLAICAYFALMAILATALRGTGTDWSSALMVGILAAMTVAAMVLIPSARARSWLKIKLAKHLFEHRYDYRTEWLRFTETLGRAGPDAPPLSERIVQAFADIADAPGGLLLVSDGGRGLAVATAASWPGSSPAPEAFGDAADFWSAVEDGGAIIEFEGLRKSWANAANKELAVPTWLLEETGVWAGIPLLHHQRLVGLVVLATPEYRRQLDWEDLDLLRTAGNQAASSLAEALGQEALSHAQRFEEFNRRFAFILHDIKNLVSQLSLLARNAERHADNPEFRADMVATLQSSVGKMNELLTRLAPHSSARVQRLAAQPLRPILRAAIAARRRDRRVDLVGELDAFALVDSGALDQAIGHLIENALDASSVERVVVRVSNGESTVAITIEDKGVGMDGDFVRNR